MINKQQVEDWLESPVTEALREFADLQVKSFEEERGLNAYVAYDAHKTQENMAAANAAYVAWLDIVDILSEGDALFSEEDEDE